MLAIGVNLGDSSVALARPSGRPVLETRAGALAGAELGARATAVFIKEAA
jgi:hypothetical protein